MNKNQEINRNKFEDIGHHLILKKKDLKNFKKFATLIMLCLDNHQRIKMIMKLSGYDKSRNGKKLIMESILKK